MCYNATMYSMFIFCREKEQLYKEYWNNPISKLQRQITFTACFLWEKKSPLGSFEAPKIINLTLFNYE